MYVQTIIDLTVDILPNRVFINSESSVAGSLTSVFSDDATVSALLGPLVSQSSSFKLGSVAFKYSSAGSPKWSFDLETSFQLPAPFTQDSPSAFNLSLAVDASDAKTLTGTFSSSLKLPGSSSDLQIGATATMSASDSEKTLALQGSVNGALSFDSFSGLSVESLTADVVINANTFSLDKFHFSGRGTVCSANTALDMYYASSASAVVAKASVDIDLQVCLS